MTEWMYSKGPWQAVPVPGNGVVEVFANVDGKRVVVLRAYGWDGDGKLLQRHDALRSARFFVALANARLAAAAPDLLDALRDLVPEMPPENAPCHYGITTQDRCGNCRRIRKALDAIERARL